MVKDLAFMMFGMGLFGYVMTFFCFFYLFFVLSELKRDFMLWVRMSPEDMAAEKRLDIENMTPEEIRVAKKVLRRLRESRGDA